jgi:Flp pilus assembly protein TadG
MKNNKGQVLVLFVIFLPILMLSIMISIEVGNVYIEKRKNQNTIKEIIKNNLKDYNDTTNEQVNTLIDINIKNIKLKEIFTSDDEIRINIIKEEKIFGRKLEIKYRYKGTKEENKITVSEG